MNNNQTNFPSKEKDNQLQMNIIEKNSLDKTSKIIPNSENKKVSNTIKNSASEINQTSVNDKGKKISNRINEDINNQEIQPLSTNNYKIIKNAPSKENDSEEVFEIEEKFYFNKNNITKVTTTRSISTIVLSRGNNLSDEEINKKINETINKIPNNKDFLRRAAKSPIIAKTQMITNINKRKKIVTKTEKFDNINDLKNKMNNNKKKIKLKKI